MADRQTPHPMPVTMRDEVNVTLGGRDMRTLDDGARFVVRRLVADAYAKGLQDGRADESSAAHVDWRANRDRDEAERAE